ncbi:PPOX class F420-dependent oxidoreductase [Jiangella muralis]|uniref:PPOX class F420-dependent oxidoreductase n=1 Tax=Jiangella muralis TaxID=702383 RepID=UPI00069CD7E8|nr:PPOX class F420-dependent oxidoreductase [Jiangella muralis]
MSDDSLRKLLAAQRLGVLATVKRDGRPQVSVVTYIYDLGPDLVRVSTRDPLAKTRNLRRDPRVTLQVTGPDGGSWAAAEGMAQLSAVARDPHDDTVEALVEHYRDARGEHPDWDDFRAAMVRDERLLLRLPVDHVYGWA